MRKIIAIPQHIINSGDDTHWVNIVSGYGNSIGTIDRNGNNLEVYNIYQSQIASVLGEEGTIADLLSSNNINEHSYYKSSGTGVLWMGDMAGYNHLAKSSTYFSDGPDWEEINRNISADGANWKITISGLALRRGEKLPPSGYVETWNDIKVDAAIYKKDGEFWEIDPTDTDSITGIDVSQMRNNTAVGNLVFNVPNTNETYRLVVQGKYTYMSSSTFESLYVIINTKKYYPYNLQVGGSLLGEWEPGVMAPLAESSIYGLQIKNLAPDEGNSQSYGGYVYVKFSFYYDGTPVNFTSTSSLVNISPQEIELIILTWDQGVVPEKGTYGWDDTMEYSVTIYEGTSSSGQVIGSKVWNSGM